MRTDRAEKVDGDLDGLKKADGALHPDMTSYEKIRQDLIGGRDNHELDKRWTGSAAEEFTDNFLVKLHWSIKNLDEAGQAQRKIVVAVHTSMEEKQKNIVDTTEDMVPSVIALAVAAYALVIVATAATTPAGGAGGAVAAGGAIAGLIVALNGHHKSLKAECTGFDKVLGDNKGDLEELGQIAMPEINFSRIDRSGWAMDSGA